MKMRNSYIAAICAVILLLVSGACKPTEKNYKAAYDAARHKKEAVDVDADILNSGRLEDEPVKVDSVRAYRVETISVTPTDFPELYIFIVGKYKMATNAKAHVENLRKEGYDGIALLSADEDWYVGAGRFADEEAARRFGEEYEKKKNDSSYIGLTAPFILHRTTRGNR